MTELMEDNTQHISNFSRSNEQASGAAWIEQLRKAGMKRFEQVGFPSRTDEEWRQTNVDAIAKTAFQLPGEPAEADVRRLHEQYSFGDDAVCELVFVNGRFSAEFSKIDTLSRGVRLASLADEISSDSADVREALGQYAKIDANPFVALNTGFINDGAFLLIGKGQAVERPIHFLYISVPGEGKTVSHPRTLIVAKDNSEATLVESYVGSTGTYLTNAVTEIIVGRDCRIDRNKLQHESLDAYHVATLQVTLGESSVFISHSAGIGSKLLRNDLNVVLNGERADATLNGLVLANGNQLIDNHTLLDHAAPNCTSHELYKYILNGKSTGVFKGKIFVNQIAQKTDSKQTSKCLLLSDDATMNSQPALEIYADDVKCTHGSTTGPVDDDMVFYLRSRGLSLDASRHLLTYAFAADVTRRIKVEPVRRRLENYMAAQHGLPLDLRITDLGAHDDSARNM